jgi:2-polyprenyl-3-methyl-5-hydroxy-6-metoxy-1,4-benzoquinol methylase
MIHAIPVATSVDRVAFILKHCAGKRVLDFGASGPMHAAIVKAAVSCLGVDRADGPGVVGFDLDNVEQLSLPPADPEIIICGEVLEHLSNPGWFLTRLRRQFTGVPVVITVPNAFADAGRGWLAKGVECVNKDHVAWYSPKTLSVLLQRAGYTVGGLFWYGGTGPTAEGLVVVTE